MIDNSDCWRGEGYNKPEISGNLNRSVLNSSIVWSCMLSRNCRRTVMVNESCSNENKDIWCALARELKVSSPNRETILREAQEKWCRSPFRDNGRSSHKPRWGFTPKCRAPLQIEEQWYLKFIKQLQK